MQPQYEQHTPHGVLGANAAGLRKEYGLVKTRLYEKAVEHSMAWTSRGNVGVQLTGTKWGISHVQWERLINADLREPKFGTPRCTRQRRWDVNKRLAELPSAR